MGRVGATQGKGRRLCLGSGHRASILQDLLPCSLSRLGAVWGPAELPRVVVGAGLGEVFPRAGES